MMLVDTHVHWRPCFDAETFLDAAAANFKRAGTCAGVMMLAETSRDDVFDRIRAGWLNTAAPRWTVGGEEDGVSLTLCGAENRLRLVAGRQVVTGERLEVLALGTTSMIRDGMSLHETITAARDAAKLVVLPWGVGKWTGRRGRLVRELIEDDRYADLLLADNGNRWRRTPTPGLLKLAARRGRGVIAGSDPLPIPGHARRAGGYGVRLKDGDLFESLRTIRGAAPTFGEGVGLIDFVRSQAAVRLNQS